MHRALNCQKITLDDSFQVSKFAWRRVLHSDRKSTICKISWSKGPIDTWIMSTQKLLSRLQSGLGATKLSPNVTKISVSLAMKGKNECAGARYAELKPGVPSTCNQQPYWLSRRRHFIRENLPTVQYNNPSVEYEIIKSPESAMKPLLTVSFGKLTDRVMF